MEQLGDLVRLLGGGLLLYLGAEWLVGGASVLALALRVPQLLVGLTVVAYGTSTPEIIVGMEAAVTGHGEVALGNVIGSNVANIGLILGLVALVQPAKVDGTLRRRELPALLASAVVIPLLLLDATIGNWEALALLWFAGTYTVLMVRAARGATVIASAKADAFATQLAADAAGAPASAGKLRAIATASAGLVVLLIGGNVFIEGAVSTAQVLGISDRLVGITIVAVGTSLPELVTSLIAARRGHSSLAVGNVIGSNIFNTFLCLGIAGISGSVGAPLNSLGIELGALLLMTGLAVAFIRTERTISRVEGAVLLALYLVFTVLVVLRR